MVPISPSRKVLNENTVKTALQSCYNYGKHNHYGLVVSSGAVEQSTYGKDFHDVSKKVLEFSRFPSIHGKLIYFA